MPVPRRGRGAADALQTRGQQSLAIPTTLVTLIRRVAVRRVVLDTAIFRRVMRRRNHDAVRQRDRLLLHQMALEMAGVG